MILCAENICFIIHKICQKGWKRKKSIEKLPTTLKGVSKEDKQIVLLDQFYFSMKKKICLLTLDMKVQTQQDKQIALLDEFNKFVTCIKWLKIWSSQVRETCVQTSNLSIQISLYIFEVITLAAKTICLFESDKFGFVLVFIYKMIEVSVSWTFKHICKISWSCNFS